MAARVSDRLVEIVAAATMIMVGIIGYLNDARQKSIIEAQKATNTTLKEVVKTMGDFNVRFENHNGRITINATGINDNKNEIRDVNIRVDKTITEINKLKGYK
jgi:hypothetical protein